MLEIRIGYGDIVSEQMGIPMSLQTLRLPKRYWTRGKPGIRR